jgi:predicted small secreted protein
MIEALITFVGVITIGVCGGLLIGSLFNKAISNHKEKKMLKEVWKEIQEARVSFILGKQGAYEFTNANLRTNSDFIGGGGIHAYRKTDESNSPLF